MESETPTEDAFVTIGANGIGELVLNRPERKNALSPGLVAAVTAGLQALIADPAVKVILIRGNGPEPTADNPTARWLCSGVDLKEQARVRKKTGTDGGQGKNWAAFHSTMYSCPKVRTVLSIQLFP
jgi:enoyl-CoA hydratase/carnithine racemase